MYITISVKIAISVRKSDRRFWPGSLSFLITNSSRNNCKHYLRYFNKKYKFYIPANTGSEIVTNQ